ncbi:putative high-affinity methionine permease [Phaeomoniella chlamydospora]|uniref:Putative high-affinity methionine permease n=1 Tax=Phaeomoniella chlamydospora TaxID=158046 RepID=A0A0G2FV10_PHACM|nr:putative high-affinity methionine permease [Phaeomoniella chlamydospora]
MSYVVLLGFSTPNCIVMGEYIIYAVGLQPSTWLIRTLATITITSACVMHAKFPRLGVHVINVLGVAKMIILAFVVSSGLAASVLSFPNSTKQTGGAGGLTTAQRNFSDIWAGSSSSPYAYSTALLKILYCFRGYNTANTVLSSVRRPIPTLKVAAPLALSLVAGSYILANIAYFCAVDKEEFREAGVVLAGRFLSNLFGATVGERVLPWLVIISAFGNVSATSFAQARVNQELGRDGLLPYSDFWAGNTRLNMFSSNTKTPSTLGPDTNANKIVRALRNNSIGSQTASLSPSLFLHFFISALVILLPPPGQIYTFLLEIGGYPVSIISVAVAGGLLYLQLNPHERWNSPIPARKIWVVIFFIANLGVCILPWINPGEQIQDNETSNDGNSAEQEKIFPYYAYPATGLGILVAGAYYWIWWRYLRPLIWPERPDRLDFDRESSDGDCSSDAMTLLLEDYSTFSHDLHYTGSRPIDESEIAIRTGSTIKSSVNVDGGKSTFTSPITVTFMKDHGDSDSVTLVADNEELPSPSMF